ncbi:hypothetical protein [Nocardiopsis sp. JB363]|uniref:hypothetical protein n=1 Tax=Nocardiopsis sp. JB363 TaxID=1434837 RepID=UPI001F33348D|nr:hypothetical protein [Nocardiopsis sp. JB363]
MHPRERGTPDQRPGGERHRYEDATDRDHADYLNTEFPAWWVYWSLSRRGLYAFYLGPALVRPLFARRVQQLRERLYTYESHLHAPPVAHHRSTPTPPAVGGQS